MSDWTVQEIDESLFAGAKGVIEEMKQDQMPLVMTFIGEQSQVYDCRRLMDNREQIGALVKQLVGTPGLDFVAQIAQGYALRMDTTDRASVARVALWRMGTRIADIPGRVEVVTVTIYDKTKPQCECWSVQHTVEEGYKLTRGELYQLTESVGRMTAPIPRRQDA